MAVLDFIKNRSYISTTIFIVIILYAVSSVVVLSLVWGIFPSLPGAYLNPYVTLGYAITSFLLTMAISAYHLSTMIRRRKRKSDKDAGKDEAAS